MLPILLSKSNRIIMATAEVMNPTSLTPQPFRPSDYSPNSIPKSKTKPSLNELESIRHARLRTFSHWPHSLPSSESMASAGWFSCNVKDRVICIYCNLICHEWTVNDDPSEVHARLAPQCLFVQSMSSSTQSPKIMNSNLIEKLEPAHPKMAEPSRRQATFAHPSWTIESPSIDDLVRAGFYFSGLENIVTCFYCNGSLKRWGPKDIPMIEHARWFPNCHYARHLCGNRLYGKIQVSKKRLREETKVQNADLNRLVAARLDLPMVQRLRNQYSLGVIKRCIEDQLRIKKDDFVSDTDLTIACLVLQKQIDHIKGCVDNLIIPSTINQQSESLVQSSSKQSLGECFICLTEEKQLACMPCGHLCACVPCGYALRTCPVCRQNIQSFMRINC